MFINKILDKDETHWQWYKSFFNITVLRYLVTWFAIVPVAAKLLASINPHIKIKDIIEVDFIPNPSLSFTLEILWLSSLFYVIALLLYQAFCPRFIKNYSSYGDYKHHSHSPRWIIYEAMKVINDKDEIGKLFTRLNEKKYLKTPERVFAENIVVVEENQTVAYFKHESKSYSVGLPVLQSDKTVDEIKTKIDEQEIFWEIFGRFSTSKKYWRLTIIILLFISLGLFLYTLGEHIFTGLQYFL